MIRYNKAIQARLSEIKSQRAAIANGEDPRAFIPTGLAELDKRGGIKRGILTLFGAGTGIGKSIVALHLATNAAKRGYKVLWFSFEDPFETTVDRTLSNITGLNSELIAGLNIDEDEESRLELAANDSDEWGSNIELYDGLITSKQTMQLIHENPADLVLIDYVQSYQEGDNLERTIAELCWNAQKHAQDSKSAVVAFSQVRGGVEERGLRMQEAAARKNPEKPPYVEGFRPFGASDLAWCTAAGQRCKALGFLFRPNFFKRKFGQNVKDDVMEITFAKRNFGGEGNVRVGFDGRTARLYDIQKDKP